MPKSAKCHWCNRTNSRTREHCWKCGADATWEIRIPTADEIADAKMEEAFREEGVRQILDGQLH